MWTIIATRAVEQHRTENERKNEKTQQEINKKITKRQGDIDGQLAR